VLRHLRGIICSHSIRHPRGALSQRATATVMVGLSLFAGATGVLIEIVEQQIFPGGADGG